MKQWYIRPFFYLCAIFVAIQYSVLTASVTYAAKTDMKEVDGTENDISGPYLKIEAGGTRSSSIKYSALFGSSIGPGGTLPLALSNEGSGMLNAGKFNGIIGGVGVGYDVGMLRMDVMISYEGAKNKLSDEEEILANHRSNWTGIATIYHDFYTGTAFSPFIGFGIGGMYTQDTLKLKSDPLPVHVTLKTGEKGQMPNSLIFDSAGKFQGRYSNGSNGFCYAPSSRQIFSYQLDGTQTKPPILAANGYDEPRLQQIYGKNSMKFTYGPVIGVGIGLYRSVTLDIAYKVDILPEYKVGIDFATHDLRATWDVCNNTSSGHSDIKTDGKAIATITDNDSGGRNTYGEFTNNDSGGWNTYREFKIKRALRHALTLGIRMQF